MSKTKISYVHVGARLSYPNYLGVQAIQRHIEDVDAVRAASVADAITWLLKQPQARKIIGLNLDEPDDGVSKNERR